MKSREHYSVVTINTNTEVPRPFGKREKFTGRLNQQHYLAAVALIGTAEHRYAPSRIITIDQVREVEINVGDEQSLAPQGE